MATDLTQVGELLEAAQRELQEQIDQAVTNTKKIVDDWVVVMTAKHDALAAQVTDLQKQVEALGGQPALDPRDVNFPVGIEAVKEWVTGHGGTGLWPRIYRLAAGVLTESYGGYRLANAGAAFPDAGVTPWAPATMPLAMRQAARTALAKSTTMPNDKHPTKGYTANGASVGWLQQIPLELTRILYGANWGYGNSVETSVADCMDVRKSTLMFCDRLQVTNRTTYTASDGTVITGLDPIMADLLALQQPLPAEARNQNQYGPNMVVKVKHMVDNWGPRYFTDAPSPPILVN